MKLKNSVVNLTSIVFVLCLFLEFIVYKKVSFFYTTNILFTVASFFLIISLFWSVLYSGAFDFFHFSMKKVTTRMRREDSSEETENIPLSKSVGHGYRTPLKVGLLLLTISLITLFFHYLF